MLLVHGAGSRLLEKVCICVSMFPEDLGGDEIDGPTSIWEAQEVRMLDAVNDAKRGGSFLCSLTGADQRRPLGFLTNWPSLKAKMSRGWPSLW